MILYFYFAGMMFNATPVILRTVVLMYRFRLAKQVRKVSPNGVLDAKQLVALGGLKKRTETRLVAFFFTVCLVVCAVACAAVVALSNTKDSWSECNACGDNKPARRFLTCFCFAFVVAGSVPIVLMRSDANDTCQCARALTRVPERFTPLNL